MKLRVKSTHRPVLVTTPSRSKTLIVGGKITHVNGEVWEPAYVAIMPGGAITLDDIEWEYAWGDTETAAPLVPREWKVTGSKGDVYTVREVGQDWFICDCPHYTYRKTPCKHINEVR